MDDEIKLTLDEPEAEEPVSDDYPGFDDEDEIAVLSKPISDDEVRTANASLVMDEISQSYADVDRLNGIILTFGYSDDESAEEAIAELERIADERLQHIGALHGVLSMLDPAAGDNIYKGMQEADPELEAPAEATDGLEDKGPDHLGMEEAMESKTEEHKDDISGLWINGDLESFEPKELVDKVRKEGRNLHTNRLAEKDDDHEVIYTIIVDSMGFDQERSLVFVDVVKQTWTRRKGVDDDDPESYRFDEEQDRVFSKDCGQGPDRWEKAVDALEGWKKETLGGEKGDEKLESERLDETLNLYHECPQAKMVWVGKSEWDEPDVLYDGILFDVRELDAAFADRYFDDTGAPRTRRSLMANKFFDYAESHCKEFLDELASKGPFRKHAVFPKYKVYDGDYDLSSPSGETPVKEEALYGLFIDEVDPKTFRKVAPFNEGKPIEVGDKKEMDVRAREYESNFNVNKQGKVYKAHVRRLPDKA